MNLLQVGIREGGKEVSEMKEIIDSLLTHIARKHFEAGTCIFKEGDEGGRAFVVESGCVVLSKEMDGQKTILGTAKTGSMFGEMALIDGQPRMATASAVEDTVCVELPRSLFMEKLGSTDGFTRFVINTILLHVRNMGIRLVSMAALAQVPFEERFVNAFFSHARGLSDVSYFFCELDGPKAQEALQAINNDALCQIWSSISVKLHFTNDLTILNDEEIETFKELYSDDLINDNKDNLVDLIYMQLAEKADFDAAAKYLFKENFS